MRSHQPELTRRQLLAGAGAAGLAALLSGCVPEGFASAELRAVEDLRRRLKGTVLVPGDRGFLLRSQPFNGRYANIVPTVVAQVLDEDDVVTAVRWANENGIQPVPRGGGHSYAGLGASTGLLIDMGAMNNVSVDAAKATLTSGGAALNSDLFAATVNGALILPAGTCLGVGVGGLSLGGGIGYHTRWAGLTSDHFRAGRIVTAKGEVLELDATQDSDLFWACRGGAGGSFGINTQFTFDLVEVPVPDVVYFRLDWRGADAALAMFTQLDAIQQTAPPELVCSASAQASPIGPGGAREAIDVMLRGQYLGSEDEFRQLMAPVLAIGGSVDQTIVTQPFWETAKTFTSEEAVRHSWGDISRYTDRPVPPSAFAAIVDLLAEAPSRDADNNAQFWMLGWTGGAVVDRFLPGDTAYVHRGMKNMLRPSPVWADGAPATVQSDLIAWTDEVIAVLAPHTPARSYQNFPNLRIEDWQQQYYGDNFSRLVEVKRSYDPDNVFRSAQSIPVAA